MQKTLLGVLIILISSMTNLTAQNKMPKYEKMQIDMYPAAMKGYKQVYIQLPIESNEQNLKVEILVGKYETVDCNTYFYSGTINEVELEGWGYTYYEVKSDGNMAGTKMGCRDAKKTKKFVHMPTKLIDYNSKSTIVLYVPENFEVKYRIWKADKNLMSASTLSKP